MEEKASRKGYILQASGISKFFPGVAALKKVDFRLRRGTVHALLGENGAGKSTLIKILSGVYPPSEGEILFEGRPIENLDPLKTRKIGIAVIHQELNLVPEMSIAENIFIGREQTNRFGIIDYAEMNEKSRMLLARLGLDDIDPRTKVSDLSIAYQQMVEILKAVSLDATVLIMDEPTDVLTEKEVKRLFAIIKNLRDDGKSIIYITHKLDELQEICDEYTILRDGQFVASGLLEDVSKQDIINLMVGRELTDQYPYAPCSDGISFEVRKGEVLGLFGLVGSGRTELAKALIGASKPDSGRIVLNGSDISIRSPRDAIRNDIFYTTENRKKDGAFLYLSVAFNTTISALGSVLSNARLISSRKEKDSVDQKIDELGIKTPSQSAEIRNLSGGNQQKVILARGLMINPKLMILDEPTRGIDVGAKTEIYQIINHLKKEGVSIIMISSEMPEILGISDRILVMYQGRISGEVSRENASESLIMRYAFGEK